MSTDETPKCGSMDWTKITMLALTLLASTVTAWISASNHDAIKENHKEAVVHQEKVDKVLENHEKMIGMQPPH